MNSRKNFSLLEIAISSVVFAIAILSTLAALSVNFRLQASNKETMVAMNAATEKLNLFLTDPLLFRTINRTTFVGSMALTPEPPLALAAESTDPHNWQRTGSIIFTAEFRVAGVNHQENLAYEGSISVDCINVNPDANIPLPGVSAPGIAYFEVIVVVRWTGVSGNRRVVMQGQRYRLKEDADLQIAPTIP